MKNYKLGMPVPKILLFIMRITLFLFVVGVMQIYAADSYAQRTHLTIRENKIELGELFNKIEQQTDFYFFYSNNQINKHIKVSVDVKNKTIFEILDIVLNNTDIAYQVNNKAVILSLRDKIQYSDVQIQQQTRKQISGKVTDENGEPIIGANVVEQGTTNGTVTDVDGNFILSVEEDAIIRVSYIGYLEQEIATAGKISLNMILAEDSKIIDELIVVGYGTMKKSDLTGSIASVKFDERDAAAVTSIDMLLQGKAAGVQVSTGSGSPGGAINVRIRGTSSLTGSSEPLYVVDGVVIESSMEDVGNIMGAGKQSGSTKQEIQNSLTSLNPQDVESIEVLKDASATAIYGSRGSNGVIIITTKKGNTGKPTINFNASLDFASVNRYIPMLSGPEYVEYINARNEILGSDPKYNETSELEYKDWQRAMTRNAFSQNYRISASAGHNGFKYYIAGGYLKNEGVVKATGLEQYDLRINSNYSITDKLTTIVTVNLLRRQNDMTTGTDNQGGASSSLIRQMLLQQPTTEIDDSDESTSYSPEAWLTDYEDQSLENRSTSSLALEYKINSALTARAFGAYDSRYKQRSRWFGPGTYAGASANGQLGLANIRSETINLEALLFFDKTFNMSHKISGTVGATCDIASSERWQMVNEDFFTYILGIHGMGYGDQIYTNNVSYSNYQLFSLLGRFNYNYLERYLITLTSRMDGSSKFAVQNRFSYFPAVSLAWRLGEEEFLNDIDWMSNLKLRAGWGQTGSQAISPFQTQNIYRNVLYATHETGTMVGMVPSLISNAELVWETTNQINIGIDLGFYNNRFGLSADVYDKKTVNLLQEMQAPLSAGFSTITVNRGAIQNKGLEFAIFATPIQTRKVVWDIDANISFNKNKIVELGLTSGMFGNQEMVAFLGNNIAGSASVQYPVNIFAEGHPLGLFWGYKTDGVWQTTEDASQYSYAGNPMQAGDIKFVDQNEDNVIDATDKVIIGDPNPDFIFGFNSNLRVGRFQFSAYIYGSYGNDIFNANLIREEDTYSSTNIRKDAYYNAWRADNPVNTYPQLGFRLREATDRQVKDGSYLRLGSLSLVYNVPIPQSTWIRNVDLSITGRNLLTITAYNGFSPDVNSFSSDPLRVGIDWGGYPSTRSFSFGVNVNF